MPPTTPSDETSPSFADLGLRPELLRALADLGYEEPTPIQRAAIPPLRAGRDLLGQAATGTGKTAAFALPLLDRLPIGAGPGPLALVLVPTRELAIQVSEAMHRYGRQLHARVLPIYGGQPIGRQLRALAGGVDVVVATPGRALDHIGRGTLRLGSVGAVVLDEADEMLDLGFAEDIDAILSATPSGRQTVLFSATLPARIARIARQHLTDPVRVELERESVSAGTAPLVAQRAFLVARAHKAAALGRVLDIEAPAAAIVFCRTREEVDALAETLNGRGYRAEALHGGMNQEQRDRVMTRLRSGTADLVVATDVAARGLDIEALTHVVNYDMPAAAASYVHRIGRVGRAGREGVAITLVEPREHRMLRGIERLTGQRIHIEQIPTIADLRARRLETTRAGLQEAVLSGDLDQFRVVVETLADDYDVMEIALAAVKLAYEASGAAEEEEIPAAPVVERAAPARRGQARSARAPVRVAGRPGGKARGGSGLESGSTQGRSRLFVGLGRDAGINPSDLVGAITGESGLSGRDIGAIEIADRFSLVELPAASIDDVVKALRNATIRGRRPRARRERERG